MRILYFVSVIVCVMQWLVAAPPSTQAFIGAGVASVWFLLAKQRIKRQQQLAQAASGLADSSPKLLPWERLTQEDLQFMNTCTTMAATIPRPIHSGFLVCACISYWDTHGCVRSVKGALHYMCA
jgi:hypothetical protein